jgi:purine nucleoside permease
LVSILLGTNVPKSDLSSIMFALKKPQLSPASQKPPYILMPPLRFFVLPLAAFFLVSAGKADDLSRDLPTPDHPLKVKVVILTTFEIGADTGDTPGEFQYWVERRKMDTIIPLPNAFHDARTDGTGVIAIVTGMATANAASSVMALGTDPRFDLAKAYWIVAGIAGINPSRGSLGSAVWADCVVDGDVAYEIDGREIPGSWSTGVIPWERTKPYEEPRPTDMQQLYLLNPALVDWAVRDTQDIVLEDTPAMKKMRDGYTGFSKAQEPPKIIKGATLSTSRFWEGAMMSKWAEDWVRYWSAGASQYYTTACEDSGIMRALTNLSNAKKIDLNRVLVLRTASDYDQPPPGETPAQSLATKDSPEHLGGFLPSLEAVFRVGNKVVSDIVKNWEEYSTDLPK